MSLHLRADARRFAVDALLVALVFAVSAAFARFYVGGERFFYYWDYAVHHDVALRTVDAFRKLGLVDAFYTVYQSTADDYNGVFALPLLPALMLLGESRVAYVLALALIYQAAFLFALGSVAVRVIPASPRLVFWSTVAIGLATPMAWVPTLRGFPDVGAAALVVLATSLYLENRRLDRVSHVIMIGILLGVAILFRRPFLLATAAFFSAMTMQAIAQVASRARSDRRGAAQELATALARIGATSVVSAATLLILGHHFLIRILTHDFAALYTGYQVSPREVTAWYLTLYGMAACLAAALGIALGFRDRVTDRPATGFLALFAAFSLLQWLLAVRQLGEQYTLHFTPFLVLGCSMLAWTLIRAYGDLIRTPALVTATGLLVCNLFFGLSGHRSVYQPTPFRAAFAANWPPLRRTDYDDMRRLVEFLHERAGHEQPVFIAASSHTINPDMVAHAEQSLFGRADARLEVLRTPAIDSGDVYPLETLLRASYVVLAHPFQHHLDPDRQRVVRVVLDLFDSGHDLAQDFEPLPGSYSLKGGIVATVWRRIRPTSDAVAVRTLRYVRDAVGRTPGVQPDWIVLSQLYPSHAERAGSNTWKLLTHPTKRNTAPEARWLYIHETGDDLRVTGRVQMIFGACPGITLAFSVTDERGAVTPLGEVSRRQEDDPAFAVDMRPGRGRWLILRAMSPPWRDSIHACLTWLEDVRVTGTPEP